MHPSPWKDSRVVQGQNPLLHRPNSGKGSCSCLVRLLGTMCPSGGGHAASIPLAGHAIHLSFPVPCLQASCVVRVWGTGGP